MAKDEYTQVEQDALKLILMRNEYYQRLYFLTLLALILSLLTICFLIGSMVLLKRHSAKPLYFATDSVGRLIRIIPLDQPNMNDAQLMAWAEDAVTHIYSYDYVNYHEQLQNAQKYFTRYGWTNYLRALTASNNVLALTERKMIVLSEVIGDSKVIAKGLLGGAYAWKLEIPMLSTYWVAPYDDQSKFSNPLVVTLTIQRQSVLEGYHGLGIVQIIGQMASVDRAPQAISNVPIS